MAANSGNQATTSNDAPRVTRRRSIGYYKYVPVIPPETEAFVLPSGTVTCPIPDCPGYQRPCNPHWRLNEHMKLRHGWPRKHTQPLTDKRLSGTQRSENYDRSVSAPKHNGKYTSKYCVRGDSIPDSNASAGENASPMSHPPAQSTRSAAKKGRERASKRRVSFIDSDVVMEDSEATEPETPSPGEEDTLDYAMIEEVKLLVAQLTTIDKSNGQSGSGPSMPKEVVDDLKQMLENGSLKVNTTVSISEGMALSKLYKLLANRRNQVASIRDMSSMAIDAAPRFSPPAFAKPASTSTATKPKEFVNPPNFKLAPKLTSTARRPQTTNSSPQTTTSVTQPSANVDVSSKVTASVPEQPSASIASTNSPQIEEPAGPAATPVRRPGPPEKGNFAPTSSGKINGKARGSKSIFPSSVKAPAPKDVGGFTALNSVPFGSPPANNDNIKLGRQPQGVDDTSSSKH